jgi:hypothetical protein
MPTRIECLMLSYKHKFLHVGSCFRKDNMFPANFSHLLYIVGLLQLQSLFGCILGLLELLPRLKEKQKVHAY